ncbi:MAG: hypothetical protein DWQ47_11780 [Acidobacteria bacterium]|nr:MAG: hypothetical protein DWQ32_14195 [Acidobacteriota bacterium]REJ98251.1 MAG: hypothetical protein DWQ38_16995 [Acidobacteriota bacterium]REK16995.1 MAG: hypothetical protein DWQ43_02040 [Acidobacteriota bacterium]REK42905.1 MAG: hypothetical protein DWQ47_11780 [Acidobacteriota bacterium]
MTNVDAQVRALKRPVILGIVFSMTAELVIFILWGLILFPAGNIFYKFLWAVVFCGTGMGATIGAMIQLFVIGNLNGLKAIVACTLLSVVVLGIACNLLCLNLDSHFHYFGGIEDPYFFIGGGIVLAALSGALAGWLMFTAKGMKVLDRVGI